jgi:O-antigen/teichoic acid export membrane protein
MRASGVSEQEPPEGFGARVRSALAWRWGSQLVAQFITWGSTILVVRLLNPSDYGLFAMSQVFVTALNFLNGWSFASSLIQAEKVGEREIGQVFALLLLTNGALAAVQLTFAPVVADYYGQPAVAELLRVQALIFLTIPFTALPTALLARRLEFRSQGIANLVSAIFASLTALGLAWTGFGVWALVYAPIAGFCVRGVIMSVAARLWVRPVFDLKGAGRLIGFGGALTLCQLFWIIQSQSDIFIAGRLFDAHDLGLYSESLFLTLIVTGRFIPPLNEVAFPAYAELHKSGRSLGPYFLRTVQSVLLVVSPIYIGLALTAPEAILVLFGTKWVEMAPIVSGLAVVMPLMAVQIICSPTCTATGKERIYLATSIAGAAIFATSFYVGVQFGAEGLVHAWWLAAPLLLVFTLALTLPQIELSARRLLAAAIPPAVACGAMALVVFGMRALLPGDIPAALVLAALACGGAMTYAAVLFLAWPDVVRSSIAMLRRRPTSPMPPASGQVPADQTSTIVD